jgi:hypothetical protein
MILLIKGNSKKVLQIAKELKTRCKRDNLSMNLEEEFKKIEPKEATVNVEIKEKLKEVANEPVKKVGRPKAKK